MAVAYSLAFSEFLFLHYHIGGVDFVAIPVGIASGLDPSCYQDLNSLTEIFLCKLCLSAKCHTTDKISRSISVSLKTTVNSQCVSCNCRCILSCGIYIILKYTLFRISNFKWILICGLRITLLFSQLNILIHYP